jgi:hypothetical protein
MASAGSIAARQQIAARQISERLAQLFPNVSPLELPTKSRHGGQMLNTLQLEAISNWLEGVINAGIAPSEPNQEDGEQEPVAVVPSINWSQFSRETLEKVAIEMGQVVTAGSGKDGRVLKSDLVQAIENANTNG